MWIHLFRTHNCNDTLSVPLTPLFLLWGEQDCWQRWPDNFTGRGCRHVPQLWDKKEGSERIKGFVWVEGGRRRRRRTGVGGKGQTIKESNIELRSGGAVSNWARLSSHCEHLIFTRPATFEWLNITQYHNERLHQYSGTRIWGVGEIPTLPPPLTFGWLVYLSMSAWRSRHGSGPLKSDSRASGEWGCWQLTKMFSWSWSLAWVLPPAGQVKL